MIWFILPKVPIMIPVQSLFGPKIWACLKTHLTQVPQVTQTSLLFLKKIPLSCVLFYFLSAEKAEDLDLFFIPGFGGLQAPINDPTATAGFIGLTSGCTKQVMLRAVLESIAFGMNQLLEIMVAESQHSLMSDTIV